MNTLLYATGTLAAALGFACTPDHQKASIDPDLGSTDTTDHDPGEDDPTSPIAACLERPAMGAIELEVPLGATDVFTPIYVDVAVDSQDGIIAAAPRVESINTDFFGVHRFNGDGIQLYAKGFGELVATDQDGNTFVVGMLTATTDFGLGPVTVHGDGHAFLVKLDAAGNTVFAREILPCGAQYLVGFALDAARARIAVSAVGVGTVVMDLEGNVQFRLAQVLGEVAFDRDGNLGVVGSTIDTESDEDAFIAQYSLTGAQLFRVVIGDPSTGALGAQTGTGIAFDRQGNLVAIGTFPSSGASIFGQDYFGASTETDEVSGAFVVKVDTAGNQRFTHTLLAERMADVAIDPLGDIVVSGSRLGHVIPDRNPFVTKLDGATGDIVWTHSDLPATGVGNGLGVATDSCGDVYWSAGVRLRLLAPDGEPDFSGGLFLLKFSI